VGRLPFASVMIGNVMTLSSYIFAAALSIILAIALGLLVNMMYESVSRRSGRDGRRRAIVLTIVVATVVATGALTALVNADVGSAPKAINGTAPQTSVLQTVSLSVPPVSSTASPESSISTSAPSALPTTVAAPHTDSALREFSVNVQSPDSRKMRSPAHPQVGFWLIIGTFYPTVTNKYVLSREFVGGAGCGTGAVYALSYARAGEYRIDAYIPDLSNLSNNAVYSVSDPTLSGNGNVRIDQSAHRGGWLSLGNFPSYQDSTGYYYIQVFVYQYAGTDSCELTDRWVAYSDLKFTRVD
jgi:hypothetical protein